jgi:hypothetical protein
LNYYGIIILLFSINALEAAIVAGLLYFALVCYAFTTSKRRGRPKKFRWFKKSRTPRSLRGTTIAYIISKDGYGKFGITTSKSFNKNVDVKRRYSGEPIQIFWAKKLPSRDRGYKFEAWCKSKVRVVKGREWFSSAQINELVGQARNYWGS